ncbi:MAG: FecR domain-containing protein [Cyclobacteriaceae bacterium]
MKESSEEALKKILQEEGGSGQLEGAEIEGLGGKEAVQELEKILSTTAQWDVPADLDKSWSSIQENIISEQILTAASNWEVPTNASQQESWKKLEASLQNPKTRQLNFVWLSVAASVSLILMVAYFNFFNDSQQTVTSPVGQLTFVELPDGSEVVLNAGSTLNYETGDNWNRNVSLDGKARFEVEEGSTFTVNSGRYSTTVLGTSFDVNYNNLSDVLSVSCYSGKVAVSDGENEVNLKRGVMATNKTGTLTKADFNVEMNQKWVAGEFYFNNEPLVDVIKELERQFDISIIGLDDERTYQGYFYKDDLEGSLQMVLRPMGYDYRIEGKNVMIK